MIPVTPYVTIKARPTGKVRETDTELKAYPDAMQQDFVRHDLHGVSGGVLTISDKLDWYVAETDRRLECLERRVL